MIFCETLTPGYAMLMSPNKVETALHGCHCPGDRAVRMRKVLARGVVSCDHCTQMVCLLFV